MYVASGAVLFEVTGAGAVEVERVGAVVVVVVVDEGFFNSVIISSDRGTFNIYFEVFKAQLFYNYDWSDQNG